MIKHKKPIKILCVFLFIMICVYGCGKKHDININTHYDIIGEDPIYLGRSINKISSVFNNNLVRYVIDPEYGWGDFYFYQDSLEFMGKKRFVFYNFYFENNTLLTFTYCIETEGAEYNYLKNKYNMSWNTSDSGYIYDIQTKSGKYTVQNRIQFNNTWPESFVMTCWDTIPNIYKHVLSLPDSIKYTVVTCSVSEIHN